jgi:hypothetical protein
MQPVNDFIEKIYFPGKPGMLRASTMAGYRDFYKRHLKPEFEGWATGNFMSHIRQRILDKIAKSNPYPCKYWSIVLVDVTGIEPVTPCLQSSGEIKSKSLFRLRLTRQLRQKQPPVDAPTMLQIS